MKMSHLFFGLLVLGGVVLAQDSPQHPNAPTTGTNLAAEVQALREALSQTQNQVAAQQAEIQTLKAQSQATPVAPATNNDVAVKTEPGTYDSASHELGETDAHGTLNIDQQLSARQDQQKGKEEKSPTGVFQIR